MREDWIEIELGKVCEIISGKNQKGVESPNGKYPIYGSGGVCGKATEFLCEPGTTVIGRKGTIDNPIYVNQRFWNIDTAFGISPSKEIDSKYVFYFCKGFNFHKLDKSTTIPSLAKRDLLKIQLNLAPLPEQRAIVAKIEQLFSELDNGIANLKAAKDKLEIYRQAVLKKAFEGELTKEWRALRQAQGTQNKPDIEPVEMTGLSDNHLPTLPEGWKWVKLGEVCGMKAGNFVKASEICKTYKDGLFPCYGGNGLRGYVRSSTHEGTFALIGRQGALCGNVHLVEGKFHATEHAVVVKSNTDIDIKWLYFKLISMRLNRFSSGVAQPGLSVNKLVKIDISVPPLPEQHQIVQEIESRLSVCDHVQQQIDEALEKSEALRQSILKQAFEGKLLSEEELEACRKAPDWEPAEKLLERIKTAKKTKP